MLRSSSVSSVSTLHAVEVDERHKKSVLRKYTIRSIVCEAFCHSVTWSLGHSFTWSLGHLVTQFNMLTE